MLTLAVARPAARASTAQAPAEMPLLCTPARLEFGGVPAEPPAGARTRTLALHCLDAAPVLIVSAQISGPDAKDFSLVDDSPTGVLGPGATSTLRVRFSPRGNGERRASLVLELGATRVSQVEVPLSGLGLTEAEVEPPMPPTAAIVAEECGTSSTIPIRIQWSTGPGRREERFELQESIDDAPFHPVPLTDPSATAITVWLPEGDRVRSYRARTIIGERQSEWVAGTPFAVVRLAVERERKRAGGLRFSIGSIDGDLAAVALVAPPGTAGAVAVAAEHEVVTRIRWRSNTRPAIVYTRSFPAGVAPALRVRRARRTCGDLAAFGLVVDHTGPTAHGTLAFLGCVAALTSEGAPPASDVPPGGSGQYEVHDDYTIPDGIPDPRDEMSVVPIRPVTLELRFSRITPNPCAGQSGIYFTTTRRGWAEVKVTDVTGRVIRTLDAREMGEGPHGVSWDGRDDGGTRVAPGVYFAVLRAETGSRLAKLIRQ
jgi:hypothetical protein